MNALKDIELDKVEKCVSMIETILCKEYIPTRQNVDLERTVAHGLYQKGHKDWVVNDEISGPQIGGISEKALTQIAEEETQFNGEFQVIIKYKGGTKYFKAHPAREFQNKCILPYKDLNSRLN
ncbi:MAG: hypothetical protein ACP5NW_05070 [Candidatus Woesearchaeota archaeon]